jgi:Ferritin-like
MTTIRKAIKPVFVLDELRTWLHRGPKTAHKSQQPITGEKGSRICQLGLPPNNTKKDPRAFAIFLLCAGAEVEHSLLVQYLYAAYSVNERTDEKENNPVLKWKTVLRLIAREEMAHLVTVQNLLLTLGADLHLNRTPVHRTPSNLPLPYKLQPLSVESLRKYVLFESPTPDQMNPGEIGAVDEIHAASPGASVIFRVGSIYAAIYWLFMKSNKPDGDWPFGPGVERCFTHEYGKEFHLEDSDFVSAEEYRDRAADPKEWGIFESSTHVDGAWPRETALSSLRWLMSQGEGPNAIEESHFHHFLRIYEEFIDLGSSAKSRIFHVPENPRVRGAKGGGGRGQEVGTLIKNPRSKLWGELFNARYQLMLLNILESLSASRSKNAAKRENLAIWAVAEMDFVKRIGQLLPFMFLDRSDAKRAGAPFQAVALPTGAIERQRLRNQIRGESGDCIGQLVGKMRRNTLDPSTAAQERPLLDAIARQNDEMTKVH